MIKSRVIIIKSKIIIIKQSMAPLSAGGVLAFLVAFLSLVRIRKLRVQLEGTLALLLLGPIQSSLFLENFTHFVLLLPLEDCSLSFLLYLN